jgi:hypothetical protein
MAVGRRQRMQASEAARNPNPLNPCPRVNLEPLTPEPSPLPPLEPAFGRWWR